VNTLPNDGWGRNWILLQMSSFIFYIWGPFWAFLWCSKSRCNWRKRISEASIKGEDVAFVLLQLPIFFKAETPKLNWNYWIQEYFIICTLGCIMFGPFWSVWSKIWRKYWFWFNWTEIWLWKRHLLKVVWTTSSQIVVFEMHWGKGWGDSDRKNKYYLFQMLIHKIFSPSLSTMSIMIYQNILAETWIEMPKWTIFEL